MKDEATSATPASDSSTLNPSGVARRRLIKALGLGALAAPLSLDWSEPKIRLGSLPAHAVATINGCFIGASLTVSGSSGVAGSFAIALVGTGGTLAQTQWTGSSSTYLVSFDGTQPPSSAETIQIHWTKGNSDEEIVVQSEASCCDAYVGSSTQVCFVTTSGAYDWIYFDTQDDGECKIYELQDE